MLHHLSKRLNAYGKYRTAKYELARLTDRELSDIGINRCDIEHIAREVFRESIS